MPKINTRRGKIVDCYLLLEKYQPSPMHRLSRAVAVAEWKGAAAGLLVLDGFEPPSWLSGSYLWSAVLADLHWRDGQQETARGHRRSALILAPTASIRDLLERRFHAMDLDASDFEL